MADRRTQLEQAATHAIKRTGLSSVSFRTLAEEIGVKSSSVHYHFPTKADLAESVIRCYTEEFSAELNRILREEPSLHGRLDAFIALFEQGLKDQEICLCGALAADALTLEEATRRALKTFFNVSEAWLTAVFEESDRELIPGLNAGDAARILMAGLEGATLMDRAFDDTAHLNAFRQIVDTLR